MVTWRILADATEVEVMLDEKNDTTTWQELKRKGYGVEALHTLPLRRKTNGNALEALPSMEMDTVETTRRWYLSLPEMYYAVAMDGVLTVTETLRELWEQLERSSATFTRHFVIYQHFRRLGWIPRPGLNYGAHFVLYRGLAAEFHSEYIVYVQDDAEASSWNQIQSLTRIAADAKKTVLLCSMTIEQAMTDVPMGNAARRNVDSPATDDTDLTFGTYSLHGTQYTVEAIAIRFWDTSTANEPSSYTFLPQPVLPKKIESAMKKRVKRKSATLKARSHRFRNFT